MKWMTIIVILWMAIMPVFSQKSHEGVKYLRNIESSRLMKASNFTMVSFEVVKGIILVQAEIEGHRGNFILDTGAPSLIINGNTLKGDEEKWVNLTGEFTAREIRVKNFNWAGIQKNGIDAIVLDISHLEKTYQRDLLGVIGYQIFSDHEILIDAINMQITIYKENNQNEKNQEQAIAKIPFAMQGHMPVIEVGIGPNNYTFGLDSGCSANLIGKHLIDNMPKEMYKVLRNCDLQGFLKESNEVPVVHLNAVSTGNLPASEMEFLVTDLSQLKDTELKIDGLLGYPFFENLAFSIDYNSQQIIIWKKQTRIEGNLIVDGGL